MPAGLTGPRAGLLLLALVGLGAGLTACSDESVLELDWSGRAVRVVQNNVKATEEVFEDGRILKVSFQHTEWPNVTFRRRLGLAWNWDDYQVLEIDVFNPSQSPVPVSVRVDNAGADGYHNCITQSTIALPGTWTHVRTPFKDTGSRLWGMRGLPGIGPIPFGAGVDPTRITAFQVFLPRPDQPQTLYLGGMRLIGGDGNAGQVEFPFIDKFGQYRHEDWPGKIHSLEDLLAARDEEEAALLSASSPPRHDATGGWIDGPQREATGWFRTEMVDGRWWLVTPQGRLFFSLGLTCVGTWERTFVQEREEWFEWLPARNDPNYGRFYYRAGPAHSMADPVDGHGLVFTFYGANLVRKYGADGWEQRWREVTFDRMRAWGFNTIGAWSDADVLRSSPVPFTAKANATSGVMPIAAGEGYWGRMADVFDPDFPAIAERHIAPVARQYADNPLCIGYFVDNELAWNDVRTHTLGSPPEQPARRFLISMLQDRYGSIESLNAAWGTSATDWDSLYRPSPESEAARSDLDDYVYAFAERYFRTVRDILRTHAPNQLYLGCRFAGAPEESVLRAAADYVDVLSLNLYYTTIDRDDWNLERTYRRPVIIGEFHFGALDRGMFHTGLQPATDQTDRAEKYANYVRSVASNPAFVGCHWFQYIDEPTTGRWFDGENYNIGFVTVTDTPYPELVEAATAVHNEIYTLRSEAPP